MSTKRRDPEYLKIGEAAELLGVNRRTVYRWIWNSKLPASKVGGLYYIRRADLEALLTPESAPQDPFPASASVPQGVVSGPLARLRERIFLEQIQRRVEQVETLIHPFGGDVLTLRAEDWAARRQSGDDRLAVMQSLGKLVLDSETAASMPLNPWLRWEISAGGAHPLHMEARSVNRLEAYVRLGYDSQPLGMDALQSALEAAGAQSGGLILVCFSATGWESQVCMRIQQGVAPASQRVLLYLLDGVDEKLVYNDHNEQLRGYADVFSPPSMEALSAVLTAVHQAATEHSPYSLQQAEAGLPFSPLWVRRAFERLATGGEFALQVLPGQGLVLVKT